MNCEICQDLISDFLDGALSDDDRKALETHLDECLSCEGVREELDTIVTYCRDHRGEYDAPPNEKALWLRIRNTIESQRGVRAFAAASSSGTGEVLTWVSGLFRRHWELSLPQMAAAVFAIAICVSLATAIGMRKIQSTQNAAATNESDPTRSSVTNARYSGNLDEWMRPRQQVIEHWNKRIEERKALWSAQTRGAFERNLQVIDQAVYAYREELQRNPHDQVSAEMLDTAMSDKMDLLSEFAEL